MYLLLKLSLLLLVANANDERRFSARNFVDNQIYNRMEDKLLMIYL